MGAIPEWAKALRKKNTEVREIRGKYYLYAVCCRYDKVTKKRKKIKPVYLGRLVEGVGFIPKVVPQTDSDRERMSELEDRVASLSRENEELRSEVEQLRGRKS